MRALFFALCCLSVNALCRAESFMTIGLAPNEVHTKYSMRVHDGTFPENDLTLLGYRWQITFGGSTERWEMYGQFRGGDTRWAQSSHVTQNEQGYQTVSMKRWQWDRALAGGYHYFVATSPGATVLLGGGVLLGTAHGHQQEKQTTTLVHEDHSREVTTDYIYEYELGGLKAGLFTDFGSRIRLTNYLFLEALLELSTNAFTGVPVPSSNGRDNHRDLDNATEASFNINLRWDMERAVGP